jgi:MFS family permease
LIAVGIFGIGDFAHTLLILAATQILTPRMGIVRAAQIAALLYVLRNVVYTAASFPVGALADRIGHRRILVAGYLVGALMAAGLAAAFFFHSQSLLLLVAVFVLAGFYIAAQDTLEATLTSLLTDENLRGTAYGALGTVNGVGDFFSSTMVGAMWTLVGPEFGFGIAALLMAAGTYFMARRVRGE